MDKELAVNTNDAVISTMSEANIGNSFYSDVELLEMDKDSWLPSNMRREVKLKANERCNGNYLSQLYNGTRKDMDNIGLY